MCGHNPLHHVAVSQNHSRDVAPQASVPQNAPPQVATHPCPQCSEPVQEDFVFCPRCGAELLTACPECHRALDASWTHCAYCGADLVTSV